MTENFRGVTTRTAKVSLRVMALRYFKGVRKTMNSSLLHYMSHRGGVPWGAAVFIVMGVLGQFAPINLFTGIQVTHTNQRRARVIHCRMPVGNRSGRVSRCTLHRIRSQGNNKKMDGPAEIRTQDLRHVKATS